MKSNQPQAAAPRTGAQTLEILQQGEYLNTEGKAVSIKNEMAHALQHSLVFDPATSDMTKASWKSEQEGEVIVEVTQESMLECVQRIWTQYEEKVNLCVLVEGSAQQAGGKFQTQLRSQEERFAASSGLYPCLSQAKDMYQANKTCNTSLYTHFISYSPQVPVFRNVEAELLDQPIPVSFVVCPAVSAVQIRQREPEKEHLIAETMKERIQRVLWAAAQQGHRVLVLEAFGCGTCGNDPTEVAQYFHEILHSPTFEGAFERVVFAIGEYQFGERIQAFGRRFLLNQDPEQASALVDPQMDKEQRKRKKKMREKVVAHHRKLVRSLSSVWRE